jgi:hypothetical protein
MTDRNWTRATIAALHLRLPELADNMAASRVLEADALLKGFNPGVFDPSKHPRWPAGSTEGHGGEFRPLDGGDLLVPISDHSERERQEQKPPGLPTDREPTQKELNRYARVQSLIARRRVMAGTQSKSQALADFMDATGLTEEIGGGLARILAQFISRFDKAKSLEELKAQLDRTPLEKLGYEEHHIVEQGPNEGKISGDLLQSKANRISIPYYAHRDISDFYSTPNPDYGGSSPRDFLRGKSFDEQYQEGLKILRKLGVLK